MNLIVNVDKNWAIGLGSKLLVRIPQDMKYFRSMTTGHVVVMGRKTLESFPESKPLPNRVNIVLTRDQGYQAPGAVVVHSMEEFLDGLEMVIVMVGHSQIKGKPEAFGGRILIDPRNVCGDGENVYKL